MYYPKVKVRDQGRDEEDEAVYYKQRDSCLNSNGIHSYQEHSETFVAKIPKIYVPSVVMPPPIRISEDKNRKAIEREVKPNLNKTSPILRPRAVISSPDNDALIGDMNKNKERKGKKSNDQIPNKRHLQANANKESAAIRSSSRSGKGTKDGKRIIPSP